MKFAIETAQSVLLFIFLFFTYFVLLFFTKLLTMFSFNPKYRFPKKDSSLDSYWKSGETVLVRESFFEQS
jgi:hypothetical protein